MFEKDDKRNLYWLMEQYLSGKINARTFCDEYHYSYGLEIDDKTLSDTERRAFAELSSVSSRFSEFKADIERYPGVYFTGKKLRKQVHATQEELREKAKNTFLDRNVLNKI